MLTTHVAHTRSRPSDIAMTAFAATSAAINTVVAVLFTHWQFDDANPAAKSVGAWWHMASNCVFLMPIVPHVIQGRPVSIGGLHPNALQRSNLLLVYVFVMATISFVHHSMQYDTSRIYVSDPAMAPVIPILWRSIDWSLSRLSPAVGVYATLGVYDLVWIARPNPRDWWIRNLVAAWTAAGGVLVVMNDMRYMASSPFSDASIAGSVAWGVGLTVAPFVVVCIGGGYRTIEVVCSHYCGCPHGFIRTANLVVCVVATFCTRVEGDDSSGFVHSMWHFTTASILAAAMCLVFDGGRHCGALAASMLPQIAMPMP